MSDKKINYCICGVWSGDRAYKPSEYLNDRAYILRKNLEYLSKVNHNLSQITIIINESGERNPEFDQYVKEIPSNFGDTKVVVLVRPNVGISYGAFSYCFELYRDQFDYFIFVEDDYVFYPDYFDDKLLEIYKEKCDTGYLCGFSDSGRGASISNGMFSNEVLTKIYNHYNELPHAKEGAHKTTSQVVFSQSISKIGIEIYDWLDTYSSPFYDNNIGIVHFGDTSLPPMIMPIQLL